jgi:HPt (histidine-containing phosphotransfer) domain-containing protein
LRGTLASLGRKGRPLPPPVAARAPDRVPLDESRLLARVGGDRRALARLVRLFVADSRKLLAQARRAVTHGKAPELRAAAHALKGSVSNFAAPAATAAAARLQQIAEAGDLAEASGAYALLNEELARVRKRLSALVSRRTATLSRGT